MLIRYTAIVLGGFLSSIFFISLLRKFSLNYKLLISKDTPLIGGLGMGLSFILVLASVFLLYKSLPREIIGIIISSSFILIFGAIDDSRELSIQAKFLVQMIATGLLVFFGVRTQIIYIGSLLNIIITFIWVIGISNAFNHLDVMDGVASGSALIISCAFFIISLSNGDARSAILSLALAGIVFGFLLFNLPPAKVYMGNSGSHFLGFVLAAVAVMISYASLERKIALLSPLLILGLPIFDTFFLILVRIGNRRLPYKKSNDHLSLRLLRLGCSKVKALLFMLLLGSFFSLCGVMLSRLSNSLGIAIIGLVILVSLILACRTGKVPIDG